MFKLLLLFAIGCQSSLGALLCYDHVGGGIVVYNVGIFLYSPAYLQKKVHGSHFLKLSKNKQQVGSFIAHNLKSAFPVSLVS